MGSLTCIENSFCSWSKLQNREEETKNGRENTDVNDPLNEIEIEWDL